MSDVDPLTGVATRRVFATAVEELAGGPAGRGCVVLLDLDRFGRIRDRFGMQVSDMVLPEVGPLMRCSAGSRSRGPHRR
jgi:diguanylate cyclase (GGDEF)-like protein